MASTYTPIATTTFTGSATSFTFSSIPSTYTDLILICSIFNSSSANTFLRFNSDTSTAYSRTRLSGNGTTATSDRVPNSNAGYIDAIPTQNPQENIIVNLSNYSNTTTFKNYLARANNASTGVQTTVGLWRSTSAINSILISCDAGTMTTGTTFTLYGIQAA